MTKFSAGPQSLGYLYQVRYALLLLLDREDQSLRLEGLDDIDLLSTAKPLELLQLKHRASGTTVTDLSSDLWKSLRVWCTHTLTGKLDLDSTLLTLCTTAKASSGTAASKLRNDSRRNVEQAANILRAARSKSKNAELTSAFSAFEKLEEATQNLLLSKVYILDSSPTIFDSERLLEQRIAPFVRREVRTAFLERLEGWWFARSINQLQNEEESITGIELADKAAEFAESLRRNNLPLDFLDHEPSDQQEAALSDQPFVHQLNVLHISPGRIRNAILDYYQAYEQRSRWARNQLLIDRELEDYERRLEGEWNRMRLALIDDLEPNAADEVMQRTGKKLYNWMELQADFRIRPGVTHPYVMRGSYHMLANETEPRVWWHPEFLSRLRPKLEGTF